MSAKNEKKPRSPSAGKTRGNKAQQPISAQSNGGKPAPLERRYCIVIRDPPKIGPKLKQDMEFRKNLVMCAVSSALVFLYYIEQMNGYTALVGWVILMALLSDNKPVEKEVVKKEVILCTNSCPSSGGGSGPEAPHCTCYTNNFNGCMCDSCSKRRAIYNNQ